MCAQVKKQFSVNTRWCSGKIARKYRFHGQTLQFLELAHPDNVIWENLSCPPLWRRIIRPVASLLLLAVFFIVAVLSVINVAFALKRISTFLPFVTAVGLFLAQMLFRGLVKACTWLLRFTSTNDKEIFRFGYSLKADILLFGLNTWGYACSPSHSILKLVSLLIIPTVSNVLFYVKEFSFHYGKKYLKARQISRNGSNTLTQSEAEELYKPHQFNYLRRVISLHLFLSSAISVSMIYPLIAPLSYLLYVVFVKIDKQLIAKYFGTPQESDIILARKSFRVLNSMFVLQYSSLILFQSVSIPEAAAKILELENLRTVIAPIAVMILLGVIIPIVPMYYAFFFQKEAPIRRLLQNHFPFCQERYDNYCEKFKTTYSKRFAFISHSRASNS